MQADIALKRLDTPSWFWHEGLYELETAEHMSHANDIARYGPRTLVFLCQRSRRNSNGVIPNHGAKCMCGELKSVTFDKSPDPRKQKKVPGFCETA